MDKPKIELGGNSCVRKLKTLFNFPSFSPSIFSEIAFEMTVFAFGPKTSNRAKTPKNRVSD